MTKSTTEREYLDHTIKCAELQGQEQLAGYYREQLAPTVVDISTVTEYGLTQKLSNSIRCF